ncbi:altered inheritance of mitochondria protein 21 [Podospora conica]|nr:altered inheritance of mitochondria protein 21 [Schizothecium conicum]
MSATATQQPPPSIPPRPSRSQEKASLPMVPPRPANRRLERSLSPNHDRFAPSPLNEALLSKSPRPSIAGIYHSNNVDRTKSVEIPSTAGEEGLEYAAISEEASSPEHTRTVGDLKLHAPKPSLPAVSAKQRVMAVTRTDSDRAAAFGIGRPSSNDDSTHQLPSNRSLKKKASTTSQLSATESQFDDEHGIPEIGQQVPMYPNAGDVQAPSPAPSALEGSKKHHTRRSSSRGIPPGSYGLHGHGLGGQEKLDKLDKAYYEKHPEALKKEKTSHHHDRANDFSMSKDDLEKIVRETASRGSGIAVKSECAGTPSEYVAYKALEEKENPKFTLSDTDAVYVDPGHQSPEMFKTIDMPSEYEDERNEYTAPILADDEVAKDPSPYQQPAVAPGKERLGSALEMDESISRPSSRPTSLYKEPTFEKQSTPLEDVEEYEPLFGDEDKAAKKPAVEEKPKKEKKQRFPSADVWEDAPSSVHYTAEVSTPDIPEEQTESATARSISPPRDTETPAQAFARHQEELAEKEAREGGPECFLPGHKKKKPSWVEHQTHLASEPTTRPKMAQRFPSRDVWEDTPDSLLLETTVSTPQNDDSAEQSKPESPDSSAKPAIPERRPKPRQGSADDKPAIPDRPKPQIPSRPVKASPSSGGLEPAEAAAPPKQKPAVPARPVGSKIAALSAGFMSDLNQRLRLGPQAPKKEEPAAEEAVEEEKEKAPLSDARKGRARGPQRRAPAKSASPAPPVAEPEQPKLVFTQAMTLFEIDPEEGEVSLAAQSAESKAVEQVKEEPKQESATSAATEEKEAEESKEEPSSSVAIEAEDVKETEKAAEAEPVEEKTEEKTEDTKVETQSLVTNMAGETILEETVKKAADGNRGLPVEPIATEER